MKVLIVRCANGTVIWGRSASGRLPAWKCQADSFVVPSTEDPTKIEQVVLSIAQHSAALKGTIQQVVELDI